MSRNAKLIIVLLIGIVGVSAFMIYSTSSQKTALEKEKARLEAELAQYKYKEQQLAQENKQVGDQLRDAQSSQEKLQRQLGDLSTKLTNLTAERDDWRTRVDGLKKERDQLIAKLQEKPEPPPVPAQPATMPADLAASGNTQDSYWGQVLREKAGLELRLNELQSQLSQKSVDIEELKKKNSDMELELGQLKNEKEDIERHIKYNEDVVNTLSIDLAREKNDKRYIVDRTEKFRAENVALRAQIKGLSAAKFALEKTIAKLTEDKKAMEDKLATTESVIQSRADEVMTIKKSLDRKLDASSDAGSQEVELPPIIVSAAPAARQVENNPSSAAQPQGAGWNGHILNVNNDNNFVIIDLGEDSGIQVGDSLSVYRGSKYIADLEIIQVRKDICAADIKQKGTKILVGDSVK